ncbi:MAG: hypothetical protein HFG56_06510 [Lachnospiraceae bacterium]|nr:hypothetical protein [Lachnospiraceae bacterium]
MADFETKKKANIGSSSLILIFIVLCLATFGLLSLGNARGDELLSVRNAAAVKEYYRADGLGEEFLRQVDQSLQKADAGSVETVKEQVLAEFGDYYQEDRKSFLTDIPMDAGQALRVELGVDWQKRSLEVRSWKVYIQEEYEIDQSVRVWSGTE